MPTEPVSLETTGLYDPVSLRKYTCDKKATGPVEAGRLYFFPPGSIEFVKRYGRKPSFLCKRHHTHFFQHGTCISHTAAFSKGEFFRVFCKDCRTEGIQRVDMGGCRRRVCAVVICLKGNFSSCKDRCVNLSQNTLQAAGAIRCTGNKYIRTCHGYHRVSVLSREYEIFPPVRYYVKRTYPFAEQTMVTGPSCQSFF